MKIFIFIVVSLFIQTIGQTAVIKVPQQYGSIQTAIDAAQEGDTIVVARGIYSENLNIKAKAIVLVSEFVLDRDSMAIEATILAGRGQTVLSIWNAPGTIIQGFSIINGDDGISTNVEIEILNNLFYNNIDAVDYESGGGLCANNRFHSNIDDAIDLDGSTAVKIIGNTIVNNNDDGIEIRCHPHESPPLNIEIRNNVFEKNREDGIQIIHYPENTDRNIVIQGNTFKSQTMAAIGFMSNGNTVENYEAARSAFPIVITDNVFEGNKYGLTGSGKISLKNNVFNKHSEAAIRTQNLNLFHDPNKFIDNLTIYSIF